tara:strand:+ start:241 stop:765 length:525 start_codon:yes stop_codon:yes gene_type:complete
MPEIVNQTELSKLIGVTARAIRDWESTDPTFPQKDEKGNYDAEAVVAWRSEKQMDKSTQGARRKVKDHKDFHSARKEKANADLAEFRLRVMKSEYIAAENYHAQVRALLVSFKKSYDRMPHELAARLADRGEQYVREMLDAWGTDELNRVMDQLETIDEFDSAQADAMFAVQEG